MTLVAIVLLAATFTRPLERVTTLDPVLAQSAYDMRAVRLVYEPVLAVDYVARPYRLVPGACELPQVSADGCRYSFRMRSKALSAGDVVRELERLRDPATASPNGFLLKKVASVSAPDDRTLEIRLKERQHVFPWMLSCIAIRKQDGTGTGPYELVSWRKNHEMVFRRREVEKRGGGGQRNLSTDFAVRPVDAASSPRQDNDEPCHCPPPSLHSTSFDTIRYLVIDDASTKWLMFLKGEVDMLGEISRDNWDSVVTADGRLNPRLAAQGIRLCETPTLDSMYVGVNMEDPVLGQNRKLRQALNCAFDFPSWRRFYNGCVEPSDGPVPHGVGGRLDAPFAYAFDLEKAKRLLAEAGYPDGVDPKTGNRLALTLSIGKATQESREAGELLASFYARVGIRLDLSFMTWKAFLKAMNERRCQLFLVGWVGDYPDAENFLQLFHSGNASPGFNHSNYANPAFDREYEAAMASATAAERNGHWKKCQEIVREDCPWIFTHYPKAYSLVRKRVGNYIPGAFPYGNEQFYREEGSW